MTLAAVAFALGVALVQQLAELPGAAWALALAPLGVLAWVRPRTAFLFAFALGVAWSATLSRQRIEAWLAPALEGREIQVIGVVAGLPAANERGARFEFDVESSPEPLPPRLLLSWYRSASAEEGAAPLGAALHPGERWLLTVRLRRPHGNVNQNGFDFEAWLLERGIGATGYVRQRGEQRRLGERGSLLDRVEGAREAVRDRFLAVLGPTPAAGVLAALAVGDQHAISGEEWQLF
ncbi:MAG: ComEC/Rec2 family competence protein, partial [Clostridia bacterium]